jgi:hypothetical protein
MNSAIQSLEQQFPNNISLITDKIIKELDQQDLMLISLESWKVLVDSRSTG